MTITVRPLGLTQILSVGSEGEVRSEPGGRVEEEGRPRREEDASSHR